MMIRNANPDDAQSIADIWNPMIRESVVTFNSADKSQSEISEMITTRQNAGHGFWIAEKDGALLGFATYSQFRGGVGYARTMEHTIILSNDARGKGVGRELMTTLEDHARRNGVHSMFAGVAGENRDGVHFHASLGYEEAAVLKQVGFKFGRWMDLVLMQKIL